MDFGCFLAPRASAATLPHFSVQGRPEALFSQCSNSLSPILKYSPLLYFLLTPPSLPEGPAFRFWGPPPSLLGRRRSAEPGARGWAGLA